MSQRPAVLAPLELGSIFVAIVQSRLAGCFAQSDSPRGRLHLPLGKGSFARILAVVRFAFAIALLLAPANVPA